jgi:hypothetical protein
MVVKTWGRLLFEYFDLENDLKFFLNLEAQSTIPSNLHSTQLLEYP